jgi:coatomer subunit beta
MYLFASDCYSIAAASCFINVVNKESDDNVKLIVLDRLDTLRSKHGYILDGLNQTDRGCPPSSLKDSLCYAFDPFHSLTRYALCSSADMEVHQKAITIVVSMMSSRNVEDVTLFLKKRL